MSGDHTSPGTWAAHPEARHTEKHPIHSPLPGARSPLPWDYLCEKGAVMAGLHCRPGAAWAQGTLTALLLGSLGLVWPHQPICSLVSRMMLLCANSISPNPLLAPKA